MTEGPDTGVSSPAQSRALRPVDHSGDCAGADIRNPMKDPAAFISYARRDDAAHGGGSRGCANGPGGGPPPSVPGGGPPPSVPASGCRGRAADRAPGRRSAPCPLAQARPADGRQRAQRARRHDLPGQHRTKLHSPNPRSASTRRSNAGPTWSGSAGPSSASLPYEASSVRLNPRLHDPWPPSPRNRFFHHPGGRDRLVIRPARSTSPD